jgi:MFS family permease
VKSFTQKLIAWLPKFDRQVWILMAGRLLSQVGTGFVLFYGPIFFVNQVGLSAATVGLGIGSESISGVLGRILGGSFADSPRWGRRKTLLLSAAFSALADLVLALSHDFPTFLAGNLLMGLGVGLYWPATEAVVADLTTVEQRNEAYALTRLADSVGLGLGVVLGGSLIAATAAYRALFVIDSLSFVVFFGVIFVAIAETLSPQQVEKPMLQGWKVALGDRVLLVYVAVNILFTTYLALINSALPLYFTNFIPSQANGRGFEPAQLSVLFSWYVLSTVLCQLPMVRYLNRFSRPQALIGSALLWAVGFGLVWVTGIATIGNLLWATLALGVIALATVAYTPSASSLVVTLSPVALRGVYLSINSLCWAMGYLIGPILGGWAMAQPQSIANGFWIATALSVAGAIAILQRLHRLVRIREFESEK